MISCPAAKQIRWVKPSIATVSPSRTRSATASRIDARLEVIGRPAVVRAAQDAELVPLRVAHLRPERPTLLDEATDRRAEALRPLHLFAHRARGPDLQGEPVLHRLRLGDVDERQHRVADAVAHDLDALVAGRPAQDRLALAVPEG